tara:strand:+ start:233 stop:376 length:144 start_codon:yes stop_codon:yes gene_type:complete
MVFKKWIKDLIKAVAKLLQFVVIYTPTPGNYFFLLLPLGGEKRIIFL